MLVAHPDDELIFGGSLMLESAAWNWSWTLCTATHGRTSERGQRFLRSADALLKRRVGITDVYFLDQEDFQGMVITRAQYEQWRQAIIDVVARYRFAQVFSHNRLGEYGHGHHMALHTAVKEIWPESWSFYCRALSSVIQERRWGYFEVPLDRDAKVALMRDVYPDEISSIQQAQPRLYEEMFDIGTEAFTRGELMQ